MSRTFRTETREVQVAHVITCNACGETVDAYSFCQVLHTGSYGSILGDGTTYSFDLCEACLKKIVDGLVVPAEIDGR